MSNSRCLPPLVFLGSIALAPLTSWADAVHDRIPIHPDRDPASICDHVAGNLVKNCGFETGNLTDWTSTPSELHGGPGFVVTSASAHSGFHAAAPTERGGSRLPDLLSQVISTMPGHEYDLSFFLSTAGPFGGGFFSTAWDGTTIFNAPTRAFPYTQFSFVVPGHGHDTLEFAGARLGLDSNPVLLDDIVVTPVPEPGTLSLFGLGLLLGGALLTRKKKHHLEADKE